MAKTKKRAGKKKPAAKKKAAKRKAATRKPVPAARPVIIPGAWPFPMPSKS